MPTPSTQTGEGDDDFARNMLRPDNYELFDIVRDRLNRRDPVIPIAGIAAWLGVNEDDLIRWVIKFSEKRRPRSPYQGKTFAALRPPQKSSKDLWADDEGRRRDRMAQKARDGARATREALAGR